MLKAQVMSVLLRLIRRAGTSREQPGQGASANGWEKGVRVVETGIGIQWATVAIRVEDIYAERPRARLLESLLGWHASHSLEYA